MLPKAQLTSHYRRSSSRWVTAPLWLPGSLWHFLYCPSVFCVFLPTVLLISSASVGSYHFCPLLCSYFYEMFLKSSLVFSILSFSCISLHYFFKKAFLSLLDILWNSVFSRVYFSLSPLPFSSPQLFLELRQTTSFPSCISFSLGWLWSLPAIQCYELLSIVLQILCLPDLIPCIFSSPPLYHKGFDLGHTWMNGLVVLPTFLQFKPEFCNNEP